MATPLAQQLAFYKSKTPLCMDSSSSRYLFSPPSQSCDSPAACDKSAVENPGLEDAVCESTFAGSILSCHNSTAIEGDSMIQVCHNFATILLLKVACRYVKNKHCVRNCAI